MNHQTSASPFDIIIVGSGPGGYVAAIRGAQLGLKVAIVESKDLGGVCLNWGCIPTKALLRTSEIYHLAQNLAPYGLEIDGKVVYDVEKIVQRSRDVAAQLASGIQHLLKKNKIEIIHGHGRLGKKKNDMPVLIVKKENDATEKTLEAKAIILATGARSRILPGMEPDGIFLSSKEAMIPSNIPTSLLVIGSGAIGAEFASFYNAMGSKVTLIEMQKRILPSEDEEISEQARLLFEKRGIVIHTETTLSTFQKRENAGVEGVLTHLVNKKSFESSFDKVIVAVGIIGNTENLGLEGTKVVVEKGQILVNEWGETGEKNIFAIGDVIKGPWLAHKASHEGVLCVERIAASLSGNVSAFHRKPINVKSIPGCTYTMPQIASIGLTEMQAKERYKTIKVGRFPFVANGKAIAMGETDGFIKTIFDEETGAFLGAHMIGTEVTEMISAMAFALQLEATEEDFMHIIFPHPTLSEMIHESALSAYKQAIHI